MGGGGSTEIVPALKRMAALPKRADVLAQRVVVTDGYVTVETEVFQLVRQNLDHANVFAFGIGSSVNRHLIEGIARAGQGEAFIVTKPEQARRRPSAAPHDRLAGADAGEGALRRAATSTTSSRSAARRARRPPVVIFGKWRGDAIQGATARLVVEGHGTQGAWRPKSLPSRDEPAAALRPCGRASASPRCRPGGAGGGTRARSPRSPARPEYSLLTNYTSFIAVDHVVRNRTRRWRPRWTSRRRCRRA
jgi:Ca-activated chloride channel family protein